VFFEEAESYAVISQAVIFDAGRQILLTAQCLLNQLADYFLMPVGAIIGVILISTQILSAFIIHVFASRPHFEHVIAYTTMTVIVVWTLQTVGFYISLLPC
jgi:hypothetical protein